MSIVNRVADVLILKLIVPPTLTLNGSAKPTMFVLGLGTSHVVCGVPVSAFSHATGLPHAALAGMAGATTSRAPATAVTTGTARHRSSRPRSPPRGRPRGPPRGRPPGREGSLPGRD